MYGKLRRNMGLSLIVFAFFFLFEPTYGLYDIFPDVIGYVIMLIALINLADISTRISEAFCGFRRALILSILRYVSLYIVETVFEKEVQMLGLLIFVFLLGVFEIIVLIPAYKALFTGLLSLGIFHESEAVYLQKKQRKANATEKLYGITISFILVKNIVCSLPDFTTLESNSSYEFITVLRVFACLIVLPVSIIWLICSVKYFTRLKNDTVFVSSLTQAYLKKTQDSPQFYTFRVIKVGMYMMLAAFVLSFDIYSENVNILPDIFFFSMILLSSLFLAKYSTHKTGVVIFSLFGSLTSIALYISEKSFFEKYPYITAVKREADAYYRYYIMLFLYILQAAILVITVACVIRFLRDIFYNHTGFFNQTNADERKELHSGFKAKAYVSLATATLSALGSIYHIWSLPFQNKGWYFYYSGIFSFLLSTAFIVSICTLISYILNEIKHNYRLHL